MQKRGIMGSRIDDFYISEIEGGVMRKDTGTAKIKEIEIERKKKITRKRYIRFQPVGLTGRRVEQYFGLSHRYSGRWLVEASASERAYRARFTMIMKNIWDGMCREMAFNTFRGSKLVVAN